MEKRGEELIDRRGFLKLGLKAGAVTALSILGCDFKGLEFGKEPFHLHYVRGTFRNLAALHDYLKAELAAPPEAGQHFYIFPEGAVTDYLKKNHLQNKEAVREIAATLAKRGNSHAVFTTLETLLPFPDFGKMRRRHTNISNTIWFVSPLFKELGYPAQAKRSYTEIESGAMGNLAAMPGYPADAFRKMERHYGRREEKMMRKPYPELRVEKNPKVAAMNCSDFNDFVENDNKGFAIVPAWGLKPRNWNRVRGAAVNDRVDYDPKAAWKDRRGPRLVLGGNDYPLTRETVADVDRRARKSGLRVHLHQARGYG